MQKKLDANPIDFEKPTIILSSFLNFETTVNKAKSIANDFSKNIY